MIRKRILTGIAIIGIAFALFRLQTVTAQMTSILSSPWHLSTSNGAAEAYESVNPMLLTRAKAISITYNLHGVCLLPGDASALVFDQNGWKYVSLSAYGRNCMDGIQEVIIPLTDFKDINSGTQLDPTKPLTGSFHVRIWAAKQFTVDINNITLDEETPVATSTETSENVITGLTENQTVSGIITVGYNAVPEKTKAVRFFINDSLKSFERLAPYYLGGDEGGMAQGWDTRQLADGTYTLRVKVNETDGSIQEKLMNFRVNNTNLLPGVNPSPSPTISALPTFIPTAAPTIASPTPTPLVLTPSSSNGWAIRSVDAMKDTKDAICLQRSEEWIHKWLDRAVEINANYVAISMPYENPSCGNAEQYAARWVKAIRSRGLNVWHRQMPLSFEGIYNVAKTKTDYLSLISAYIKNHPDQYADGDIFTPIPEPQNGGINGITYCANNVCQWETKEAFNAWLREAISTSRSAFNSINKTGMKIGYFGFDGFVAWGANNPDWNGILEDATVAAMGNITIDHYPELIGTDMATDIAELEARYPGVDIIIGEWGTVTGGDTENTVKQSMGALKRPSVKGFNYWQFGPSGSGEQLINDDFSKRPAFDEVQALYQ